MAIDHGSFRSEYYHQLAKLEANNFWFCSRNRLILLQIRRHFSNSLNFFEIGCGTGFVLSAISKAFPLFSLYGSDVSGEGLKFAKQQVQKATLFQMDAREILFNDRFDVIGAFDMLEHVKEDDLVLSQMRTALRKDGGIILTVPQHDFLWSKFDDASCHVRRYNSSELKAKVESAGFKVIKTVSFVSLLLPFMFAFRAWERLVSSKDCDAMKSLDFNPLLNSFLKKILDLEYIMIRSGVSFPFGGSLCLIARKI